MSAHNGTHPPCHCVNCTQRRHTDRTIAHSYTPTTKGELTQPQIDTLIAACRLEYVLTSGNSFHLRDRAAAAEAGARSAIAALLRTGVLKQQPIAYTPKRKAGD